MYLDITVVFSCSFLGGEECSDSAVKQKPKVLFATKCFWCCNNLSMIVNLYSHYTAIMPILLLVKSPQSVQSYIADKFMSNMTLNCDAAHECGIRKRYLWFLCLEVKYKLCLVMYGNFARLVTWDNSRQLRAVYSWCFLITAIGSNCTDCVLL